MKRQFFFAATIFYAILSHAQILSTVERGLLAAIDKNMPSTLALLRQSVNINSGTLNVLGVKKTGDLFAKELKALGFATEWISLPDSLKRAGHLVAFRRGRKGKRLLLIGHLDTVFEPEMPANPFAMLNDSTATGQGVEDMKGGDVEIIEALKALSQCGLLDNTNITVYMTGDEENAGKPLRVSRADLIARSKELDIALAFENAEGLNTVVTARRGASSWELEVEGEQAHSSTIFSSGYGSIFEAARIINTFREKLSGQPFLTFNPALFAGGTEVQFDELQGKALVQSKNNIIAPKTVVTGDLRFLSEAQKEKTRDTMRMIVSGHLPGSRATISFRDGIPAMPPTQGNDSLMNLVGDINQALGYGPVVAVDPGSRGAGDVSYVASRMSCLDGLGADGRGAHAPGETINLARYPKLIKRTTLLIYRLTR